MKKMYDVKLNNMECNYVRTYIDIMNRHNSDVKYSIINIDKHLFQIRIVANEKDILKINNYIDTVTSDGFLDSIMNNNSL